MIHSVISKSGAEHSITPFGVGLFGAPKYVNPYMYDYHIYLAYIWKAAVYILARNPDPVWYQVSFKINSNLINNVVAIKDKILSGGRFLTIERLADKRAIVTWEKLLPES